MNELYPLRNQMNIDIKGERETEGEKMKIYCVISMKIAIENIILISLSHLCIENNSLN